MDESTLHNVEMNASHSIYFKFVRFPHQELDLVADLEDRLDLEVK